LINNSDINYLDENGHSAAYHICKRDPDNKMIKIILDKSNDDNKMQGFRQCFKSGRWEHKKN
jgi:hypothetical protein